MKKIYLLLLLAISSIFLLGSVYFIDLPSPSKIITEDFKLSIK